MKSQKVLSPNPKEDKGKKSIPVSDSRVDLLAEGLRLLRFAARTVSWNDDAQYEREHDANERRSDDEKRLLRYN